MMPGFLSRVNSVISEADVVLEVIDARMPGLTRNRHAEELVKRKRKALVIVLNKSDLVSKRAAERAKKETGERSVFVSGTERKGAKRLRQEIMKEKQKGKRLRVAVIGYPNTGKSSIVNMLSGRKAAKTSPKAGYTRGEQLVRVSSEVYLMDTPGVIPYEQRNQFELCLVGAKNPNQVSDAETIALLFVKWAREKGAGEIEGISTKDEEEFLEKFALKRNKLLKGAAPDTKNAAQVLLNEWQRGKIRI